MLKTFLKRRHLISKVKFKLVFTRVDHFGLIQITNLVKHRSGRKKTVVRFVVILLFHGKNWKWIRPRVVLGIVSCIHRLQSFFKVTLQQELCNVSNSCVRRDISTSKFSCGCQLGLSDAFTNGEKWQHNDRSIWGLFQGRFFGLIKVFD